MERAILAVMAFLALSGAAAAQVDEEAMEAQRCIWRCLADADGADDPAYNSCVAAECNGEPAVEKEEPSTRQSARPRGAATGWTLRSPNTYQADLIARSVDDDFGIDLSCQRLPKGTLIVTLHFGFTVDWRIGERATLYFDGQPFQVTVGGTEDGVMLSDMVDDNHEGVSADFIGGLRSAQLLTLTGTSGGNQPRVAVFNLGSSERALQDFEAACRRIGR